MIFPAYAEDRSLKGAFSGWYCDNGIIYSKHSRLMCALNATLHSPARRSLADGLCCLPVAFVPYRKNIEQHKCPYPTFFIHSCNVQTALTLWQQPPAAMAGGPGSGWAGTAARPAPTLLLWQLLTQASTMMPLQRPKLKHVCTRLPSTYIIIPFVPKIAVCQDHGVRKLSSHR